MVEKVHDLDTTGKILRSISVHIKLVYSSVEEYLWKSEFYHNRHKLFKLTVSWASLVRSGWLQANFIYSRILTSQEAFQQMNFL